MHLPIFFNMCILANRCQTVTNYEWVRTVCTCLMLYLTQSGGEKIDAIAQTTHSDVFSRMDMYEFRLNLLQFIPNGQMNIFQITAWGWLSDSQYRDQWWKFTDANIRQSFSMSLIIKKKTTFVGGWELASLGNNRNFESAVTLSKCVKLVSFVFFSYVETSRQCFNTSQQKMRIYYQATRVISIWVWYL